MSSFVSFEDCHICGKKESLRIETDYREGEEWRFCGICGYSYNKGYVRDDDGEIIEPAKRETNENINGGVINVKYLGNPGAFNVLIPRFSTEEYVRNMINEIRKENGIKRVWATWFDEKNKMILEIE